VLGGAADRRAILTQSLQISDSKTVRSSVGAGLIWVPLRPLRLDYAYPASKAAYDVTQRLRFSDVFVGL
jgi:outer membrane protein assembly factor BamA